MKVWQRYAILALVVIGPGWLAIDGAYALVTGDYITPSSGRYAGQLGPWAALVEAAGLDPRATYFKALHFVLGAATVAVAALWTMGREALRPMLMILVAATLWYIPFGTIAGLVILAALYGMRGHR